MDLGQKRVKRKREVDYLGERIEWREGEKDAGYAISPLCQPNLYLTHNGKLLEGRV